MPAKRLLMALLALFLCSGVSSGDMACGAWHVRIGALAGLNGFRHMAAACNGAGAGVGRYSRILCGTSR